MINCAASLRGADPIDVEVQVPELKPSEQSYDFDGNWYLQNYSDVKIAVQEGLISSAFAHYLEHGRHEGRAPSAQAAADRRNTPQPVPDSPVDRAYTFDGAWYAERFLDVKAGLAAGQIKSAFAHYQEHGRFEGRLPSAQAEHDRLMSTGIFADDSFEIGGSERRQLVETAWSGSPEMDLGWYWAAHPLVRARLNRLSSGNELQDGYGYFVEFLQRRDWQLPIQHAISIGCGFGALERGLLSAGYVKSVDAFDIAPKAIESARHLARESGFSDIRYHVADLEQDELTLHEVDVVFAHQSVHHIEQLEALFRKISTCLKPGGFFHLNEFVGPNRFQWTDAQIAIVNDLLDKLPARLRALPSGKPKPPQGRATVTAMIAADPSEAVRSGDIMTVLAQHFDLLEVHKLGGTILHLALGGIAQNFDTQSEADCRVLEAFFAAEDEALRSDAVESDFVEVIARKRE